MLDTIVGWLTEALTYAVNFLPNSPFEMVSNSPAATYLGYVNWFMPVSFFLTSLETWLTAVAVYYAISAILRWVKAIT
jgi:hypothetical protein